jgi:hypothetical protein
MHHAHAAAAAAAVYFDRASHQRRPLRRGAAIHGRATAAVANTTARAVKPLVRGVSWAVHHAAQRALRRVKRALPKIQVQLLRAPGRQRRGCRNSAHRSRHRTGRKREAPVGQYA